jgi:Bacterial protein of unknown function (DUF839)
MQRSRGRHITLGAALLASALVLASPAWAIPITHMGPSTNTPPYVLPVAAGVETTSILTVSDGLSAKNYYEMVGVPDGLGAAEKNDKYITLLMNHELGQTQGVVRRHGQVGAFVSKLVIRKSDLTVKSGMDFIDPGVKYWDYPNHKYAAAPDAYIPGSGADLPAFGRFCSGSLTSPGQLLSPITGAGYDGQLYFANEENGPEGRAFAVTPSGRAWQLPRLGLFSWENTLAAHNATNTTVVMGNEDQSGGSLSQMWVYVGNKQNNGNAIDKAGLTNGIDYVVRVGGGPLDDPGIRSMIAGDPDGIVDFDLTEVAWDASGAAQNAEAQADGLSFNRIEDGAWDPFDKNVYYFLTTEGSPEIGAVPPRDGGGLWRLTFDDVEQPLLGGTLELLLDGTETVPDSLDGVESKFNKPDNMTIDQHGNILIQEDPGGNAHLARILAYRISDGALGVVARFNPALFSGATPITQDEESSGIIDTEGLLGMGTFLFDAQVHASAGLDNPAAQVERGQLLKLYVPDWDAIYSPTT